MPMLQQGHILILSFFLIFLNSSSWIMDMIIGTFILATKPSKLFFIMDMIIGTFILATKLFNFVCLDYIQYKYTCSWVFFII